MEININVCRSRQGGRKERFDGWLADKLRVAFKSSNIIQSNIFIFRVVILKSCLLTFRSLICNNLIKKINKYIFSRF